MLLVIIAGSLLAYSVAERAWHWLRDTRHQIIADVSADAAAIRGRLVISVYGVAGNEPNPPQHQTGYVNGPDYRGMEDNDLRGFLDGYFKYDWNQPTQIHVRLGRRSRAPYYGELGNV